jgi:Carboxypeptidase regulatory-like domain/Putative metal-binding motif
MNNQSVKLTLLRNVALVTLTVFSIAVLLYCHRQLSPSALAAPQDRRRDYILPGELPPHAGMVRELASKKTQAQAGDTTSRFPAESTIQYTAFNSQHYTLHAYSGKYVRWALPDSWLGSDGFSPQEVRQLVDLSDLVYAYMAEIVRGEPVGQGLVTVAVVDVGPNAGALGRVGFKGIEISPGVLTDVKANLALGLTSGYFNHELAHNFDIYRNYLSYYGDWGHAWTNFLDPSYIRFYSRMGSIDLVPENVLTESLSNAFKSWDAAGQNATWARCVRNGGGCEADGITANDAWAVFAVRFARLHGPSSVTRAFQFLSDYKANNNPIPITPEDKNDLFVRALAFGAGVNIGCEVEAWRWTLSAKAQSELSVSFPNANLFCIDNDGDNFTELQGDFDDHKSLVHPGAIEVTNNIDDDCNGYVDDILLNENQDFTSNNPPTVSLPVRITGNTANRDDWDFFNLEVSSARRLDIRLSSASTFGGWLQRLDPFTTLLFTDPNKIIYGHFIPAQSGEYALAVIPQDNKTGNYEVVISEHSQPNPVSLSVAPGVTGNTVHITATGNPSLIGNQQPTFIRFWADGIGFFRTVPFAQSTSIDWVTPPEGGQVGLRAQLLAQDIPITAATDPLFINTEARPLYSLSGQITEDGIALPGVTVTMSGSTTATTQTAADGSYSFTMLEAGGAYTLTPTKFNYNFTPATQTINNLNGLCPKTPSSE